LDLHVDRAGLDPLKGNRRNALNHAAPSASIEGSGSRSMRQEHYRNNSMKSAADTAG
jgi:hypothetical protein